MHRHREPARGAAREISRGAAARVARLRRRRTTGEHIQFFQHIEVLTEGLNDVAARRERHQPRSERVARCSESARSTTPRRRTTASVWRRCRRSCGAQFPGSRAADVRKLPEQLARSDEVSLPLGVARRRGRAARDARLRAAAARARSRSSATSISSRRTSARPAAASAARSTSACAKRRPRWGSSACSSNACPTIRRFRPIRTMRAQNVARLRFYERYGARPDRQHLLRDAAQARRHDPPYLVFDDRSASGPAARATTRSASCARSSSASTARVSARLHRSRRRVVRGRSRACCARRAIAPRASPRPRRTRAAGAQDRARRERRARRFITCASAATSSRRCASARSSPSSSRTGAVRARARRELPAQAHQGRARPRVRAIPARRLGERAAPASPSIRTCFRSAIRTRPPQGSAAARRLLLHRHLHAAQRERLRRPRARVDCALTAARSDSRRRARSPTRSCARPAITPSGAAFGGFCYFNSAAIAAHYLSAHGRVAVLDIDYHHGNGTQDIFYERADVLTVSIHGHPRFSYPYFSGYEDERGARRRLGFNLNIPLPESIDGDALPARAGAGARRGSANSRPRFSSSRSGSTSRAAIRPARGRLSARDLHDNGQRDRRSSACRRSSCRKAAIARARSA